MLAAPVAESRPTFRFKLFVIVVEKFASSPNAAASSFKVFKVPGAESTRFARAVVTYAVVASFVLLSLALCVVPVVAVFMVPDRSPEKVVAVTVPVIVTPPVTVSSFLELSKYNSTAPSSIALSIVSLRPEFLTSSVLAAICRSPVPVSLIMLFDPSCKI